jgi:hypothetical protein
VPVCANALDTRRAAPRPPATTPRTREPRIRRKVLLLQSLGPRPPGRLPRPGHFRGTFDARTGPSAACGIALFWERPTRATLEERHAVPPAGRAHRLAGVGDRAWRLGHRRTGRSQEPHRAGAGPGQLRQPDRGGGVRDNRGDARGRRHLHRHRAVLRGRGRQRAADRPGAARPRWDRGRDQGRRLQGRRPVPARLHARGRPTADRGEPPAAAARRAGRRADPLADPGRVRQRRVARGARRPEGGRAGALHRLLDRLRRPAGARVPAHWRRRRARGTAQPAAAAGRRPAACCRAPYGRRRDRARAARERFPDRPLHPRHGLPRGRPAA